MSPPKNFFFPWKKNRLRKKKLLPSKTKSKSNLNKNNEAKVLEVDNVVICAGQIPFKELHQPLLDLGKNVHVIGGADFASELDAKRAINQGARLAAKL